MSQQGSDQIKQQLETEHKRITTLYAALIAIDALRYESRNIHARFNRAMEIAAKALDEVGMP